MNRILVFLITSGLILAMNPAQAGKPSSGEIFYTEFGDENSLGASGAVFGSAYSNPTTNKGNIDNLVFNKPASQVDFNIGFGSCPGENYTATMHLVDGFGGQDAVVARFWFRADGVSYVLELFDTEFDPVYGPTWIGGSFPPFDSGTITRSAESWAIRPTKSNVAAPCTGAGNLDTAVEFSLSCDTCP